MVVALLVAASLPVWLLIEEIIRISLLTSNARAAEPVVSAIAVEPALDLTHTSAA